MQLLNTLTLLSSAAALVSAGCFSGGEIFNDKNNARNQVGGVCSELVAQGYAPTETRPRCRNGVNQKYDFSIRNTQSVGRAPPSYQECVNRLTAEINGCNYGGQSTFGDWTYKSDPNNGFC